MRLTKRFLVAIFQIFVVAFISCESANQQNELADTTDQQVGPTAEERLATIKSDLKIIKGELAMEGEYNCCIQPACNWCLLNEGDCDCHENLKAGEEVCPGCGLGWHNGRGVVKGVKASQVKWGITHQHGDEGDHGNESHGEEDHGNSGHKH